MLIKNKRPEYKNPETELVARLIDRAESEGIVTSDQPEFKSVMGLQEGFIVSFLEDGTGWSGLAFKRHRGKDVELKAEGYKSRGEAGKALFRYIRAFNGTNK